MSNDNGGSAFPEIKTGFYDDHGNRVTDVYSVGGMTLRDYFAGQALASVSRLLPPVWTEHDAAKIAYAIADAMIAERAK